MKGNKRELIQLGVPIFGQIKEDVKSKIIKEIVITYNCLLYNIRFGSPDLWFFINDFSDPLIIMFYILNFFSKAI